MSAGRTFKVRRILLLAITCVGAAWSAALTFGGGITIHAPWGRVSSRDPIRPLAIATAAILLFTFLDPKAHAAVRDAHARLWASRVALLIAALALLGGLRFGTYTAGGSDPSGYVSESALWREGRLVRPAPEWLAGASWPRAEFTAAPLGYLPGPTTNTQVPGYPPGYPLLMALAHRVAGADAEYGVVPIAAAILVWASFMLGARLAGPWGGVITAAMVASSPPFLMWLVMPMGDVPVAACWTVALVCALAGTVGGAVGAGAASALAVAIRPNLAPLAVIVAAVVVLRSLGRVGPALPGRPVVSRNEAVAGVGAALQGRPVVRAFLAYAAVSATGILLVAAVNYALYGHPLRSGYGDLNALYSIDFIGTNVQRYGSWFLATQTALPFVALLAPWVVPMGRERWVTLAVVVAPPLLIGCLYLPYRPFEDWPYLRFLLPAYPSLFAGVAIVFAAVARRWERSGWVPFGLAAAVALLTLRGLNYSNAPTDLATTEPRYRHVAAAAGAVAPAKAIFISFQHSGSLRYYTGRDILRWDLMDPVGIDVALNHLASRGYRLYWVGDQTERETMQRQLRDTRFLMRVDAGRRQIIDGVWLVDLTPGA
jgi:hypothetical protein